MSKKTWILSAFITIKFLLHLFLINPEYDLQRDEYLHLDQGRHLAWGYESVPPFTSWISWIILHLGHSVFWVKFFPALFGALTIVVVWKTIAVLNGNLFALIMGAVAISFSVLPRINILYQPNSFDILSWTVLFYTLICYTNTGNRKWLYYAAIVFSLGFLNKYNIGFLIIGLIPALLVSAHRKLFLNRDLLYAVLLSLSLISPNLFWQYHNHFPVVHHLKELAATQLVHVHRSDFLKGQLLFFFNSFFLIIIAGLSFFLYPPLKQYRFVFWSCIFTITLFTYLKAKDYYAIGLYPVWLAFGAVYLEALSKSAGRMWFRTVAIIIPLLLFALVINKIFPVRSPAAFVKHAGLSAPYRWEDGKQHPLQQDFADMLGWHELAEKTDSMYKSFPDKEHLLVLCANYGEAGAINYYSKENIQAVSTNADYVNWFHLDKQIRAIILIKDDPAEGVEHEKQLFGSVVLAGRVENEFARERGTLIYILSAPKTDINKILKDEIQKEKNN